MSPHAASRWRVRELKGRAMLLAYLPAMIFQAFLEMLNEPAARQLPERAYDDRDGSRQHRSRR